MCADWERSVGKVRGRKDRQACPVGKGGRQGPLGGERGRGTNPVREKNGKVCGGGCKVHRGRARSIRGKVEGSYREREMG